MYKVKYLPSAKRYFKKIKEKPLKEAFQKSLLEIVADPYSGEAKTGDLSGVYTKAFNYNRTAYRIAYFIHEEEDKVVVVILAGTHENFYRELKTYMS